MRQSTPGRAHLDALVLCQPAPEPPPSLLPSVVGNRLAESVAHSTNLPRGRCGDGPTTSQGDPPPLQRWAANPPNVESPPRCTTRLTSDLCQPGRTEGTGSLTPKIPSLRSTEEVNAAGDRPPPLRWPRSASPWGTALRVFPHHPSLCVCCRSILKNLEKLSA